MNNLVTREVMENVAIKEESIMEENRVEQKIADLVSRAYQEVALSDEEYNDVLSRLETNSLSLVNKLIDNGFSGRDSIGSNGGTVYYEKENEKYVVAINGTAVYLTEHKFIEKVGYRSISVKLKNSGLVPCIKQGKKTVDCHKEICPTEFVENKKDEIQTDHTNHCLNCFIEETLRRCTISQNNLNRQRTLNRGVDWFNLRFDWVINKKYVGKEHEKQLKELGLIVKARKDGVSVRVNGTPYKAKQELYAVMTQASKILYGEFVYDLGNDFSHEYGIYLLIHMYVFGDITYKEARRFNLAYWKDIISNEYCEEAYEYACTYIEDVPIMRKRKIA